MFFIQLIATMPAYRRHGYASALVNMATAEASTSHPQLENSSHYTHLLLQADTQGRASWLVSSNISNEPFYNSLGFSTRANVILGDDNPTWHKPPVVVKIVCPQSYNPA